MWKKFFDKNQLGTDIRNNFWLSRDGRVESEYSSRCLYILTCGRWIIFLDWISCISNFFFLKKFWLKFLMEWGARELFYNDFELNLSSFKICHKITNAWTVNYSSTLNSNKNMYKKLFHFQNYKNINFLFCICYREQKEKKKGKKVATIKNSNK